MAALPGAEYLNQIAQLGGEAKVTYPYGDTAYPATERIQVVPRDKAIRALMSAEPDAARFPTNKLTVQQILTDDRTNLKMYWKYEAIPGPVITSTRIDFDGVTVNVGRQMKLLEDITTQETLTGTAPNQIWTKTTKEPLSTLHGTEVTESRAVIGAVVPGTRLDFDGVTVTVTRQLKAVGNITTGETLTGTAPNQVWTKTTKSEMSGSILVALEVIESRAVSGAVVPGTRIDFDGVTVTVTRQLKAVGNITTGETLTGTAPNQVWAKTTKSETGGSILVALEVIESRAISGTLQTYKLYDAVTDCIVTETRQLITAAAADPTITSLYTDFRDVPQGSVVKMRILRTYPDGITGKTITEYRRERYVYPALLGTLSGALTALTRVNNTKEFVLNFNIEAERPRTVPHKCVTTFQTAAPSNANMIAGIQRIEPVRNSSGLVLFNVSTGPVLSTAGTITATTGSGDPVWGAGLVASYTFPNTVPTAAAYVAARAAGDWFIMDRESKKIAQSLYMITEISIPYL